MQPPCGLTSHFLDLQHVDLHAGKLQTPRRPWAAHTVAEGWTSAQSTQAGRVSGVPAENYVKSRTFHQTPSQQC